MNDSTARTILSLDERRIRAEQEKRSALLELAEMNHELNMLRHMRLQIVDCLLERKRGHGTDKNARHTVSKIARIIRSGHGEHRTVG